MAKFLDAALNGAAAYAGKAYFFKGTKYARYDWNDDQGDAGYPLGLDEWGFPPPFDKGIDAAIEGREGYEKKAFFFKDDKYIRYDWGADKVDSGYPKSIDAWELPAGFFAGKKKIDAVINGAGESARYCYLFSGTSWVRIDWKEEEDPVLHKGTVEKDWKLPADIAKGIDAALSGWGKKYGGKAYFFAAHKYARFDWGADGCDSKNGDFGAWKMSFDGAGPAQQGAGDSKAKVNGLLLKAFKDKKIVKPTWVDIKVGDLTVTVATDALKAPALDRDAVRLGVNYKDTIAICAGMKWVVPTVSIFEAMFKQAKFQLPYAQLPPTEDMDSVGWSIQFDDKVEGMLKGKNKPGDLVFGAWKLWILDVGLGKSKFGKNAACNHGFWDPAKKHWIQYLGFQHNDAHADYSQVLQPVQRMAKAADGSDVDLLDVFAQKDKVPQAFLDPFKS